MGGHRVDVYIPKTTKNSTMKKTNKPVMMTPKNMSDTVHNIWKEIQNLYGGTKVTEDLK